MKKHFAFFFWLSLASALGAYAQNIAKTDTGSLVLHFKNVVADKPLLLNDTTAQYKNVNADDFTVNTFKYYISNIILTDKAGNDIAIPDSYFLINAADEASLTQVVKGVPVGSYQKIAFTVGVDGARNFAGAQTGCLDPAQGMFWSWNSGYIFLKFEGSSSRSQAKFHKLTFHIGGIKRQNTLRGFSQSLNKQLVVAPNKTPTLNITTDAAALFGGKNVIDFSKLSFTMGGPNSVLIADNYTGGLFRVEDIK